MRFGTYCEEAIRDGIVEGLEENVFHQMCLGAREFLQAHDKKKCRDLTTQCLRPTVEQVKGAVGRAGKASWELFASKRGDWGRDLALHLANEVSPRSLRELG